MNAASTAYVTCVLHDKSYIYHFTGVTSIEHNLTLNLEKDSAQGTDIVNGARNQADQVSLSVVETDVEHSPGWSARMLDAMAVIKKKRILCKVVTSMAAYENMLLTEITATQDEENQFGWNGTLSFTEFILVPVTSGGGGSGGKKTNTNSSEKCHNGCTCCQCNKQVQVLTPFQQMLKS
ncbi:hypothetical protein JS518_14265 [Clostridiales bacterium FE2010]|nr:hypothetical protein JS518_14265 [Clostridiales bacterium FE2010]